MAAEAAAAATPGRLPPTAAGATAAAGYGPATPVVVSDARRADAVVALLSCLIVEPHSTVAVGAMATLAASLVVSAPSGACGDGVGGGGGWSSPAPPLTPVWATVAATPRPLSRLLARNTDAKAHLLSGTAQVLALVTAGLPDDAVAGILVRVICALAGSVFAWPHRRRRRRRNPRRRRQIRRGHPWRRRELPQRRWHRRLAAALEMVADWGDGGVRCDCFCRATWWAWERREGAGGLGGAVDGSRFCRNVCRDTLFGCDACAPLRSGRVRNGRCSCYPMASASSRPRPCCRAVVRRLRRRGCLLRTFTFLTGGTPGTHVLLPVCLDLLVPPHH